MPWYVAATFPMAGSETDVRYFRDPGDFRRWLETHHESATELWVGYYKKGTGEPSLTWPESVAEALCFGWIDGLRKSVDDRCYKIRFTPRKPKSNWSAINVRMAEELIAAGRMRPAGLAAVAAREAHRTETYSYEQRPEELPEPYAGRFRKNRRAWAFFRARPPYYQRTASWWVVSAKREETRLRRLDQLIQLSADGHTLPQLTPSKKGNVQED